MISPETFGAVSGGFGVASDIYGAWQTGEEYEANSLAYRRNAINEIDRNKQSFNIQEDAKNAAEFGAAVYTDAYLRTGARKIESIEGQLADLNKQELMQADLAYEQSLAVDETVGNMMSRNAVDAMKAEARLRVSAAGTGTSGGSTQQATMEARSTEMFDNAVIIGRANSDKLNIQRRLQAERVSSKNKKKNVASEISNVFGAQGAGAAHSVGYAKSYATLSKSFKEGYISYDKVKPENTQTWMDDLFGAIDVITSNGIDRELMNMYNDYDDNGTIDDSLLEEEKAMAPGGKKAYPVDPLATVIPIPD